MLVGGWGPTLMSAAAQAIVLAALGACLPAAVRPAAEIARLAALVIAGGGAYLFTAWMMGSREWTILWGGLQRRLLRKLGRAPRIGQGAVFET